MKHTHTYITSGTERAQMENYTVDYDEVIRVLFVLSRLEIIQEFYYSFHSLSPSLPSPSLPSLSLTLHSRPECARRSTQNVGLNVENEREGEIGRERDHRKRVNKKRMRKIIFKDKFVTNKMLLCLKC